MTPFRLALLGILLLSLKPAAAQVQSVTAGVIPLVNTHAHNDYYNAIPLLDALRAGFRSVEVDIFLKDGELLVGHDPHELEPGKTIQSLYLDPLLAHVRASGGRVYEDDTDLILLIDVKTEADATYLALREALRPYAEMLTAYHHGIRTDRAVRAIVSGNRAIDLIAAEEVRLVAIDGRVPDFDANPPVDLVPLVSTNWRSHLNWAGDRPATQQEKQQILTMIRTAHEQGRMFRFWAHPDVPAVWQFLLDAGIDFINTDKLCGLQSFLLTRLLHSERLKEIEGR
jgi:hypothetical protein